MTQKGKQQSADDATNAVNPNTTSNLLNITNEDRDIHDRIKSETTPETCRADLDGN